MEYTKTFGDYDIDYTKKLVLTSSRRLKRYFSLGEEIQGIENLQATRNDQTIYISNHKSPLDALIQGRLIFQNRQPHDFAHILAASDMNLSFFRLIGYDLSRLNFCWINRRASNDTEYLERLSKDIKEALKKEKSFLVYPKGTREKNQDFELIKMKNGFLREIIEANTNPFITPMAIDYDYTLEEPFYSLQNWGRKNFMPLYYAGFVLPILTHPLSRRKQGRIYVNIAKPRRLNEIVSNSPLRDLKIFLRESINNEHKKIKQKKEQNATQNK